MKDKDRERPREDESQLEKQSTVQKEKGDCTMHEGLSVPYRSLLPGYGMQSASYKPRHALLRLSDGRLLSGSGGDIEVIHPLELERSQNTGLPVRVTTIQLFSGSDVVKEIIQPSTSDHVFVHGTRHAVLVHNSELFEGTVVASERILTLPAAILAVNLEKQAKTELLLTFLLETGLFHFSLSLDDGCLFEALQCFKCTRAISSGILWRDSGLLHIAYYDGYIRVGIVNEDYEDMLLIKRLSSCRNNLHQLQQVLFEEVERLNIFEETEREKRAKMVEKIQILQAKMRSASPSPSSTSSSKSPQASTQGSKEHLLTTSTTSVNNDDDTYVEFVELKMQFKNHSIRADRISHRLIYLKKLSTLVNKAMNSVELLDETMDNLEKEMKEFADVCRIYDECVENGNGQLISKSRAVLEEKKWKIEEMMRKTNINELQITVDGWNQKVDDIIEALTGRGDPARDMRSILCHSIFEHRPDRTDKFSHFLLDQKAREQTLYCMSGLSTLAVYPRKGLRVASISLDPSYETTLTSSCLMTSMEGVYVADDKGVFPIYFYRQRNKSSPSNREKRYFDAGNPLSIPPFDSIVCILMEEDGLFLGSVTGGLLHLAFDVVRKYEHMIIASSMLAHPFSHGPVLDMKIIAAGETHLAVHCSAFEVAISEKDHDRWHRVTNHTGGAHCLAVTNFSLEHRGAFVVAGSSTYVRLKALQYTDENLVGLHDLGESRVLDEGKPVEVINVSLDPSMEFRPLPCKLRYAIGFADKAIRTYVAILTGDHEFNVGEKFIAQIEPLHNISNMICFHGRPMGCYVSHTKTLQIWNDLDRHQQKKMKSERMQLVRMDQSISLMDRVEGRSSYLLLIFKDNHLEMFEERGKGTGRIESVGTLPDLSTDYNFLCLRTRVVSSSRGDRLFIYCLSTTHLHIHTVLIQAGRILQSQHLMTSSISLHSPTAFELLAHKPYEFALFGKGVHILRLSSEQRQNIDKFRDFEF